MKYLDLIIAFRGKIKNLGKGDSTEEITDMFQGGILRAKMTSVAGYAYKDRTTIFQELLFKEGTRRIAEKMIEVVDPLHRGKFQSSKTFSELYIAILCTPGKEFDSNPLIIKTLVTSGNFSLSDRFYIGEPECKNGATILDLLVDNPRPSLLRYMLKSGKFDFSSPIDLSKLGDEGLSQITPLMYFVKRGNLNAVKILLEYNVDVGAKVLTTNGDEVNALSFARKQEMFSCLVESGARGVNDPPESLVVEEVVTVAAEEPVAEGSVAEEPVAEVITLANIDLNVLKSRIWRYAQFEGSDEAIANEGSEIEVMIGLVATPAEVHKCFQMLKHVQSIRCGNVPFAQDEYHWRVNSQDYSSMQDGVKKLKDGCYGVISDGVDLDHVTLHRFQTALEKGYARGGNGVKEIHKGNVGLVCFEIKINGDLRLFTQKIFVNELKQFLIIFSDKGRHQVVNGLSGCVTTSCTDTADTSASSADENPACYSFIDDEQKFPETTVTGDSDDSS